ncbi:PREDICTED: regulator of G-protein signaling 22 [Gekko japonicus]|uniref:Regulator of G-protein signaling 22 n=1 Tax=Gekko japonicus TaxID=146911 RepID=A0ABM1JIQ1_GEKJA|nr:PREDICTED: regulator of G-protein signaling 22 [Gekko japonicus]
MSGTLHGDALEEYLATDDILVDFFNEFLSLPTFSERIKFNPDYGVFEVVNDEPQHLEDQLKKMLTEHKPRNPIYDVIRPKSETPVFKDTSPPPPDLSFDPSYVVKCLDREQAINWIKKERFPAFLESDCYFEYRLAKLISQVEWSKTGTNFVIDKTYYPWFQKSPPPSEGPEEDDEDSIMKQFYVSLGEATITQTKDWFTLAKQSQHTITTDSITQPVTSSHVHFHPGPPRSFSYLDFRPLPGLHGRSSTILSGHLHTVYGGYLELYSKFKPHYSSLALLEKAETWNAIDEGNSVSLPETPSRTLLRAYLGQDWNVAPQEGDSADLRSGEELVAFQTVDDFSLAYVHYILRNSVAVLSGELPDASPSHIDFRRMTRVFIREIADSEAYVEPPLEKPGLLGDNLEDKENDTSIGLKSEKENSEARASWCLSHKTYDIGSRNEFERFKNFIKGSAGERYWLLWIDIERLKALKDPRRQKRQLDRMKKIYLVSNGDHYLTSEVLFKLNLLDGDHWHLCNLRRIQSEVLKPLLLYWGPRFCVTHTAAIEAASAKLKIWHSRQQKPRLDVDPFPQMVSLLPLRAKSCMPRMSHQQKGEISPSSPLSKAVMPDTFFQRPTMLLSAVLPRSQNTVGENPDAWFSLADTSIKWPATVCSNVTRLTAVPDKTDYLKPQLDRKYTYAEVIPGKTYPDICELGSSTMERMLQSFNTENRAGYVFTEFCEKSGNKQWKNSTYFWFDLQDYHHLFYQETLHPYKLCKQAQFLYANYIAPSASMDIGLHQIKKDLIYQKIEPPFEDLFDPAEEYILSLLLVPWMKMLEQDRATYEKVELVEETRQLDSVYFRKLQALHEESISKKDEELAVEKKAPAYLDSAKSPELPSEAPEEVGSYRLADLTRNRLDLEQFRSFLDQHSASTDLMCWIDIEQFRRMLHKDKKQREDKSKEIKNKYLHKKYFFGPDSPATKEEQEQVMKLGGGWGSVLHDQVPPLILLEIQKYAQMRLEKKWLPLFLRSEESGPQKKMKPHLQDAAEDILIQKREKKMEAWKHVDNKWVSSSREVIIFRKALLNPITAFQFQRFVSLKGDLLENGVLFWQEVQKYKDMCHSHCDDAILQNKITAIINCFIHSSIPPALQIDIPKEQAQKIIEQRKELGPYVFREAQMTIFALLFKFWPQFCEFRSNLADEEILALLESQRGRKLEKQKKARAEEKEKVSEGQQQHKPLQANGTRVQRKKSPTSMKSLSTPEGKADKSDVSSTPSFTGYGRQQLSWSYSKYLEALHQERVLLKIQEDLEKRSLASSVYTGISSMFNLKSNQPWGPEKPSASSTFASAFVKQRSFH